MHNATRVRSYCLNESQQHRRWPVARLEEGSTRLQCAVCCGLAMMWRLHLACTFWMGEPVQGPGGVVSIVCVMYSSC